MPKYGPVSTRWTWFSPVSRLKIMVSASGRQLQITVSTSGRKLDETAGKFRQNLFSQPSGAMVSHENGPRETLLCQIRIEIILLRILAEIPCLHR